MQLKAHWIWNAQKAEKPFNQVIVARRKFRAPKVKRALTAVTADTWYRLIVNGQWVNDGPCRSWPEHYQYDVIDLASYLVEGENSIEITAHFYGCGTFHQRPQQAGLLFQMEMEQEGGKCVALMSDRAWEVSDAPAWLPETIKTSIQLMAVEQYDARLEKTMRFKPAKELFGAYEGPWKGLSPRDCPLLTKQPFTFKAYLGAEVVKRERLSFTVPVARLLYPDAIEANHTINLASGMATVLYAEKKGVLRVASRLYKIYSNGELAANGNLKVRKGANLILCLEESCFSHFKEAGIFFLDDKGFRLSNPLNAKYANPWTFLRFDEVLYRDNDFHFTYHPYAPRDAIKQKSLALMAGLREQAKDPASFRTAAAKRAINLPVERMFASNPHWQFLNREVAAPGDAYVAQGGAARFGTPDCVTVKPAAQGDVELRYDLGEQNVGYYCFELTAAAGTVVDLFEVEFITPTGLVQHTVSNRNGMRYVCKEGLNRFTSIRRRSGRYLYVTFRNLRKPAYLRNISLIESTYPVEPQGAFSCSDSDLNNVWAISARTLKLCMEDTYTDCPLFERTLWVGDMRNEALYGYGTFGAFDLAKRCITLTGQSLDRYPIVGGQVPSNWDMLLPAWSFLWGIAVWEHYAETADLAYLRKAWGWVEKNLRGAETFINKQGLYSAPHWNFFDWSKNDCNHETVTHNTLLFIGAVQAAVKCAKVLGKGDAAKRLRALEQRSVRAVNKLWRPEKAAYIDSIHADGSLSKVLSQHNVVLGLLYDIIPKKDRKRALANVVNAPAWMVKLGTPFAVMFQLEVLEKAGLENRITDFISANFIPMLRVGATTVWETFPNSLQWLGDFPTRSHCHAWSAAPLYFLNRIVLGIKPGGTGGMAFDISPRVDKLTWAKGASATIKGLVSVDWVREGKKLRITVSAPKGVTVRYKSNETHQGLKVEFNEAMQR